MAENTEELGSEEIPQTRAGTPRNFSIGDIRDGSNIFTFVMEQLQTIAEGMNELHQRLSALEQLQGKYGNVVADSVDAQSVKVGGVDVMAQGGDYAPKNHASAQTTYGQATTSNYGHTKLSNDTLNANSTGTAGVACSTGHKHSQYGLSTSMVDGATYDSNNHSIVFKHGSTQLFTLDAAAFVKDGMVSTVSISNGNLVITFNTDAGKQPISIPLTDIFDPSNYYTKTTVDSLLSNKADSTQIPAPSSVVPQAVSTTGSVGNDTHWSKGDHVHPISLAVGDIPGTVKIAGQNVPVSGLGWCETERRFVIDIHGSATSLEKDTPTYYATDALYIPYQSNVPSGYSSWQDVFNAALDRLANKGRVVAVYGGTDPGGEVGYKFEKYINASYVFVMPNDTEPVAIMFTEIADYLYDTNVENNRGLIRTFHLYPTGWGTVFTSWPSYADRAFNDVNGNSLLLDIHDNAVTSIGGKGIVAVSAGTANSATSAGSATNAFNDGAGNNIINTYARKSVLFNLGSINGSVPTSSTTSWASVYSHSEACPYVVGQPIVYTACINVVGAEYVGGGFATVEVALTRNSTPPSSSSAVVLLSFAAVVQSGMGSVPLTFSAPFVITTVENFRPYLWIKFDRVSNPVSVNGIHYYFSVST